MSDQVKAIAINKSSGARPVITVSSLVRRIVAITGNFFQDYLPRDLLKVFHRTPEITTELLKQEVERGGVARRIISYFPDEIWSNGFWIVEIEDPKKVTRFEDEAINLIEDHDLVDVFNRLDKAANYGKYSCLLLGIGKPGEKIDLSQPLKSEPENELIYIKVLDETQAKINTTKLVKDKFSSRYGMPEFYTVRLVDADFGLSSTLAQEVHASRILHHSPHRVTSDLFGVGDLHAVWDYLEDIKKVTGAYAELYYKQAKTSVWSDVKEGYEIDGEAVNKFKQEVEELDNDLRTHVVSEGYDTKPINYNLKSISGDIDHLTSLMLMTLGIPKRKWEGSEQGQLASGQDRKNNQDTTERKRNRIATKLVREFFTLLFDYGVIKSPRRSFRVSFRDEEGLELKEKIEILHSIAEANKVQKDNVGQLFMSTKRALDLVGFKAEDDKDLDVELSKDNEKDDENSRDSNSKPIDREKEDSEIRVNKGKDGKT